MKTDMFEHMHLQWFGDGEQAVEETPADDEEIVVVDELPKEKEEEPTAAEPDPELLRLRKENEALKKSGDTSSAIKDGFTFLQEKLSAAGVPAQAPVPDDEETFWKGVEEGLFDKQPRDAIKKAVDRQARKLVREELGPLIVSQMEAAFENAEWRLRNDAKDGPVFTTYEKEVRAELARLNLVQQKDPRELRAAFLRVKSNHVEEIIAERMLAEQIAEPAPKKPAAKPAVLMEGAAAHPGPQPKKQVFITRAEQKVARQKGMTDKAYLELKEYRRAQAK